MGRGEFGMRAQVLRQRVLLPGGWSQAWRRGGVQPYTRSNGPHSSTCRTRDTGDACSVGGLSQQQAPVCPAVAPRRRAVKPPDQTHQ